MRPAGVLRRCPIRNRRVSDRHLCFLNEYHHIGPQEEVEEQHARWKHRTLGQRLWLSRLTRLGKRECRHHQASAPSVTVIFITERAR